MAFEIRPDQQLPPEPPPAEVTVVSTNSDATVETSHVGYFPPLGSEERRQMLIAQALQPGEMTDSEMLREILVIVREGQKLLTKYMNDMSTGGIASILGAFMGGKR